MSCHPFLPYRQIQNQFLVITQFPFSAASVILDHSLFTKHFIHLVTHTVIRCFSCLPHFLSLLFQLLSLFQPTAISAVLGLSFQTCFFLSFSLPYIVILSTGWTLNKLSKNDFHIYIFNSVIIL